MCGERACDEEMQISDVRRSVHLYTVMTGRRAS